MKLNVGSTIDIGSVVAIQKTRPYYYRLLFNGGGQIILELTDQEVKEIERELERR